MNLRQLQYFVSVAETQAVSKAAENLRVSQSALSARIKELEDEVGRELFVRHSRGVKLTRAGSTLLPLASDVLHAFDRARNAFSVDQSELVTLTVGVTPTIGAGLLPYILSKQRLKGKHVRLVVKQGSGPVLSRLIGDGEIDAIIWYDDNQTSPYPVLPLMTDRLVLVGTEDLLRKLPGVAASELNDLSFVAEPKGHYVRNKVDEYFRQDGIEFSPVAEMEPFEARRSMVLSGQACTIAPKWLFHQDFTAGRAGFREFKTDILHMHMTVVFSRAMDKRVRASLSSMITDVFDEIDPHDGTWTRHY